MGFHKARVRFRIPPVSLKKLCLFLDMSIYVDYALTLEREIFSECGSKADHLIWIQANAVSKSATLIFGHWESLVFHLIWVQGCAGSNPACPILTWE